MIFASLVDDVSNCFTMFLICCGVCFYLALKSGAADAAGAAAGKGVMNAILSSLFKR